MDVIVRMLEGLLNLGRDLFTALANALGMGEYGAGFLTGVLVAGVIGFLLFRFNIWMRNANAAFQPQRIIQMTSRTPAQVMSSSLGGVLKIGGVLVVLLTLGFLVAGLTLPSNAAITAAFGAVLFFVGGVIS